jgi:uncharacterized protein (DUF2267 family)
MFEQIKAIQKTQQQTARMLKPLVESDFFANQNEAFLFLRAVLKALRDRLTQGEVVHLGSQLPALIRGFYFEGWSYNEREDPKSDVKTADEFLRLVSEHLKGYDSIELAAAVPLTLKVILDSIDQGEAIQVLHCLPRGIQELCPE